MFFDCNMIQIFLKKLVYSTSSSRIAVIFCPLLCVVFSCSQFYSAIPGALAQTTKATSDKTATEDANLCYWFRAVNSDAPAYEIADVSSRVMFKLKKGEQICCFGQKNDFAVADVVKLSQEQRDSFEKASADIPPTQKSNVVYIQASDLTKIEERTRSSSWFSQMLNYLLYWRQSGVPEDGLLPYRPIIDLFSAANDK